MKIKVTCKPNTDDLHPVDAVEAPKGEYFYEVDEIELAKEKALDIFHSTEPIRMLEDFNITVDVAGPGEGKPFNGKRVLVDEDDETVREVIRDILREEGYEVTAPGNYLSSLAFFKENHTQIDLVISNYMKDVMGFWIFQNELRKIDSSVPVLVVTGINPVTSGVEGKTLIRVLLKPFKFGELRRIVKEMTA